jgi:hypothetical protein
MMLTWERREPLLAGDPPPWAGRLPDGSEISWDGFFTGPVVLGERELAGAAGRLLGVPLGAVAELAARELGSYVSGPGPVPPSVLMHSATPTTKGFEGDLADVRRGRPGHDVATYLEARVVSLARPGDVTVGRTRPWREAAERAGIGLIDIGDTDHYYLSHALLAAAVAHQRAPQPAIASLLRWLADHPGSVVRLYALDTETQIFLVWLKRQAGLPVLWTDANSPEVSHTWNQKTHIHPDVAAARAMRGTDALPPAGLLAAEQRESAAFRRLGLAVPVLPGYLVRRGDGPQAFEAGLLAAAELLLDRYQIGRGCFKPCEAGDGARIVPHLDLADTQTLRGHARDAYAHGDHYVLEANVDFLRFPAGPRVVDLTPSGHIRGGHVLPGLTAQLMNGTSWAGNALFDERTLAGLGLTPPQYALMMDAMQAVRDAFYSERSVAEGCYQGLVTGGIDFAVGRVGGRFGDQVVIGAIDFNLSSHGAEYMRAFADQVRAEHPGRYVATCVYRPAMRATLRATEAAIAGGRGGPLVKTICCVPGRWGMVASDGADTCDAIVSAFDVVAKLAAGDLAEPGS